MENEGAQATGHTAEQFIRGVSNSFCVQELTTRMPFAMFIETGADSMRSEKGRKTFVVTVS